MRASRNENRVEEFVVAVERRRAGVEVDDETILAGMQGRGGVQEVSVLAAGEVERERR